VLIDSPQEELVVPPGYLLGVDTTATSPNRIERIELWVDGSKVAEAVNDGPAEISTFYADFSINIPGGQHVFVARAVDSASLIGQSVSKGIFADPALAGEEIYSTIALENQGTLESIAEANALDPNRLSELNPGLGEGELQPGTSLILPASRNKTNDGPPLQANPPPNQFPIPNIPMAETTTAPGSGFSGLNLFASETGANQPPKAPSDLQAQVNDCKMILQWQDNADNELGYGVWVKEIVGAGRRIASVKPSSSTGLAWFQFDALPPGFYALWVEAVNWLGSQPSNMVWVRVDELGCGTYTARDLEFKVTRFNISGPYLGVYCYVSVEGRPHVRIPTEPDYFWTGSGVPVNVAAGAKATNVAKYIFRIPDDRILDIAGDCYAVDPANTPNPKVGEFSQSIPESAWTGNEQAITIGSELYYTLTPLGLTIAKGPFTYIDSSLTPPKITSVKNDPLPPISGGDNPNVGAYEQGRILTWEWNGTAEEKSELTGFTIFLNGNPVKTVGPEFRQTRLWLPARCDKLATYEVAANFGIYQSTRYRYDEVLPPCPLLVRVEYLQIYLEHANSYVSGGTFTLCNEEAMLTTLYFRARFNDKLVERTTINGFLYPAINCGLWNIADLLPAGKYLKPGTVILSEIEDRGNGHAQVTLTAKLVNESDNELIARIYKAIYLTLEAWDGYDETFELPFIEEDGKGWISVHVTGYRLAP
jgi:hypothetical protein